MFNLLKASGRLAGTLFAAGLIASAQVGAARPGAVNYTEGQVSLEGQTLGAQSIGKTEVQPGQVLETQNGKVEMLLTPGVFLRLDSNSAVRMVSPSLTDTRVELLQGKAMVEAAQVEKENRIEIADKGFTARLEKAGIYEFNATQPMVSVYDGEATVQDAEDHAVKVGKGHELALVQDAKLKSQKFDRDNTDGLYAWSKLRSQYQAEANMSMAQTVVVSNPAWWYGAGWYWNPYFSTWAFVPGSGFFYSPFGFGFFSPAYWSAYYPLYFRGGFVNGRFPVVRGNPGVAFRAPAPAFRAPAGHAFVGGGRGPMGGRH